ncbi:cobalt ECF transporter T component CbiQ [Acetobacterium sp.]|jgi:cobalt/nickel transport system permease protein|uniref:cobalt ECF transporter T component CbiQ n=1 Tax=Acetobacterium sp. TaxID=1872094 RepID=UPI000CBD336D|nr:cobalt ECF transporter T component CbiQ [Acetobacterium sp.]MDO9492133.1 cobalt ECF transporter T component CbiQ [Acetobacterium sp.]PKM74718.1 MAG: cobalt ECF transporter T component CbiQ [Firmicutes bacterium HGW-Firmicutes-17]
MENSLGKSINFIRTSEKAEHQVTHHHKIGHKHGEGSAIDFYAYASKLRCWNPTFKVVFSFLTLLLCIGLNNPFVSIAVIIGMAYLTVLKGGLSLAAYISVLMIPITFIIMGTIAIGVDFSSQPIGQFNLFLGFGYLFTSVDKLQEMAFLMLKVFGAISAMIMMTLSTPSSEIIGVLRKAHVPKLIIELMNLIYRYIFILMDVFNNMRNSADSRQGYCDFKTSCTTFGSVASNLLVVSLKKANAYYTAMEARGYEGDLIFLEDEKKMPMRHLVIGAAFIIFLIILGIMTH